MRKYVTLYYLLFVLLIMGAFASMAQNDYGNAILGGVAIAFSLIFLTQLISVISGKHHTDPAGIVEIVSLMSLSAILGLRVFYIHFKSVEIIFAMAGIALILVYLRKIYLITIAYGKRNRSLMLLVISFNVSLVLFLISMVGIPFIPGFAQPTGLAAFLVLIGFAVLAYVSKGFNVEGERVSAFSVVTTYKDRSLVLMMLFVISGVYVGLTSINVLPKMYSDEYPQEFFKLINEAESGVVKPVNGEYPHEVFRAAYDKFVKHNGK